MGGGLLQIVSSTNEDLFIDISRIQTGNYLIYLDSNPNEITRFVKQ